MKNRFDDESRYRCIDRGTIVLGRQSVHPEPCNGRPDRRLLRHAHRWPVRHHGKLEHG